MKTIFQLITVRLSVAQDRVSLPMHINYTIADRIGIFIHSPCSYRRKANLEAKMLLLSFYITAIQEKNTLIFTDWINAEI